MQVPATFKFAGLDVAQFQWQEIHASNSKLWAVEFHQQEVLSLNSPSEIFLECTIFQNMMSTLNSSLIPPSYTHNYGPL